MGTPFHMPCRQFPVSDLAGLPALPNAEIMSQHLVNRCWSEVMAVSYIITVSSDETQKIKMISGAGAGLELESFLASSPDLPR